MNMAKVWRIGPRVVYWCWLGVLMLFAVAPSMVWAHVTTTTGYSDIRQDGERVSYELSLEYKLFAAAAQLGERAIADLRSGRRHGHTSGAHQQSSLSYSNVTEGEIYAR